MKLVNTSFMFVITLFTDLFFACVCILLGGLTFSLRFYSASGTSAYIVSAHKEHAVLTLHIAVLCHQRPKLHGEICLAIIYHVSLYIMPAYHLTVKNL